MRVTISNFGGIIPRRSAHNLSALNASIAHDVKLRNGRLEPWREKCAYAGAVPMARSFYIYGCCPLSWENAVTAAEVAPDWGQLFITGRMSYAERVVFDCNCVPTYYRLGVPRPLSPPSVSSTESCSRDADVRAYVYTYVNQWGEESAPSPVSLLLTVADGTLVNVSGIALPPDGYGVTHVNIYRMTTGTRVADGKQQKPLTGFLYVTTLELPSTTFADTVRLTSLSTALETEKCMEPPVGLQNITNIDGVIRLAGTLKNRVYISEHRQVHNWPVKYRVVLDSTIIHMGCLDQKLFVSTDTTPYVIDVSSCEDIKCIPVLDTGVKLPDISCGSASSFVMTPHGMIYVSHIGLILIDSAAKYHILTAKWFGEDDWQKIQPDTARLAYWEGFLFCVTDTVSFVINIDGAPYGDMEGAEMSTISDKPLDLRTDSVGKLFMLEGGAIHVWNTGTQWREFTWVSRELTGGQHEPTGRLPDGGPPLGCRWAPTSVKIRTRDTEFTLITPVKDNAYRRKVLNETPFRLPRVGRHMFYKIQLRGRYPVEFFDMGTAYLTVNQGA